MKRFLLFGGPALLPRAEGWHDLADSFDTLEQATGQGRGARGPPSR